MFIYFLPGKVAWRPEMAAEYKLDEVLEGPPRRREITVGPGGKSGLLIGDKSLTDAQLEYHPNQQTWKPRFGSDAWIGFTTDAPPKPLSLERAHMIPGKPLTLGDGQSWMVPELRMFDRSEGSESLLWTCTLEQTIDQDPQTGRLILGEVVPRYADVWEMACTVGDAIESQIMQGQDAKVPDEIANMLPIRLLSLNYRVGAPEVMVLKLLSTLTLPRITQIGLDIDTLRRNLGNVHRRILASGALDTKSGETQPIADSTIPTAPQLVS